MEKSSEDLIHDGNIHPSIFVRLSRAGSQGQLPEQGHPDFPLPGHFPGQLGDIVTPACPGSSSGSPPSGTCQAQLPREASRGYLKQMPKPPQLAHLNVEEQRLYSELLPGALPEVGVKDLPDRGFRQTFPADPHYTFVSARSVQLPPLPADLTHRQVMIS